MKLVLVLLSALLSVATYAQTLTGKIIDQQNQPVPFANILALDADSVFISGPFLSVEMSPPKTELSK